MVSRVAQRGAHGVASRGPGRAQAAIGSRADGQHRSGPAPRPACARLPHESLDPASRRAPHQAPDRRAVSPRTCLAPLGRARLDIAAAGQTRQRAERGGDPPLDHHALARGKKNARRRRAWIVFQDESGVSQRPPVRRTWAPRGETPVLIHAFNWKKLSVAIAVAFRWDFRRSGLCFQTRPGSYNDVTLIEFLNDLKREFRRRRVVLVWDGLPSHRSAPMQAYLRAPRSWLTVERLPGYAPDLNPAELVWGNVKGGELANLCADDLAEVEHELRAGLRRVGRSSTLAFAFLTHTGLSF